MKSEELKRVATGIPGLDGMLEGGFPVPSFILVAGEPGTGKTTFAVQSLFYGSKNGETSLYITALSEPVWVVQKFLSCYTFFDQKLVDRKKVIFSDIGDALRKQPLYVLSILMREIEKYNPDRVVIDPLSVIGIVAEDLKSYREVLHDLIIFTKKKVTLTIATYELPHADVVKTMPSYMVDGLIILSYTEEENIRKKHLEVLKLRGSKHLTGRHLVDISKNGIIVQPGLR
ncbi:MAG: ATPase domain-containing protein [Candidatus Thermoplasmatota archaeon]|nr:ATPase domain-containing protein [Candidatus Thermoplasmatota archaeon]MDI6887352.1 ATPase domain-containing protein [Candidatus Thermoplasmatota archaeon]